MDAACTSLAHAFSTLWKEDNPFQEPVEKCLTRVMLMVQSQVTLQVETT